jgi:hypothetical protein
MRNRFVLLAMTAAALAAPSAATAGGWANVELDSTPDGLAPGEPWTVELTVLQHGVTPLDGVRPSVVVQRADGRGRREFPARPTGKPGEYRATAVFESAGTWSYKVDDGFSSVHSYPRVTIGRAEVAAAGLGGAGDDGPDYLIALAAAGIAGLAAGLAAAAVQRRRRGPASAD